MYQLNEKIRDLKPYDPIQGSYRVRLDANESFLPLPPAILEEAQALLAPGETPLEDPMGLRDMDRAVRRIRRALETGETVAVYGDYDVDGITSTCLLTDCLSRLGGRVLPYIPDRLEEGYGLNSEAVSALAAQGVTLIVTVDCGITAGAETAFAASLGVDVVVTDHHE